MVPHVSSFVCMGLQKCVVVVVIVAVVVVFFTFAVVESNVTREKFVRGKFCLTGLAREQDVFQESVFPEGSLIDKDLVASIARIPLVFFRMGCCG